MTLETRQPEISGQACLVTLGMVPLMIPAMSCLAAWGIATVEVMNLMPCLST